MSDQPDRPLLSRFPALAKRISFVDLGVFPTAIEPASEVVRDLGFPSATVWVKRDDRTSSVYGGNKVRTLEVLFGQARHRGATHIIATGAFGSNHAVATLLHAPRAGLGSGVVLFPQPAVPTALENLETTITTKPDLLIALPHWSLLPFGMQQTRLVARLRGYRPEVMVPGGATAEGALGYVSAALEVAAQIEAGEVPLPDTVVLGVGSTCTSAGLLLGFYLAAQRRWGFVKRGHPAPPKLVSVRVTPWPVTSPIRIVRLAVKTSRLLATLGQDESLCVDYHTLRKNLVVDGSQLGRGYGEATDAGLAAISAFRPINGLELDTTYSAKTAAAVVELVRRNRGGRILFWSTKSTAKLPTVDQHALANAPWTMRRWMKRARRVPTPSARFRSHDANDRR